MVEHCTHDIGKNFENKIQAFECTSSKCEIHLPDIFLPRTALDVEIEPHKHLLAASNIVITTFLHAKKTLHCLLAVARHQLALTDNVRWRLCRMGENLF